MWNKLYWNWHPYMRNNNSTNLHRTSDGWINHNSNKEQNEYKRTNEYNITVEDGNPLPWNIFNISCKSLTSVRMVEIGVSSLYIKYTIFLENSPKCQCRRSPTEYKIRWNKSNFGWILYFMAKFTGTPNNDKCYLLQHEFHIFQLNEPVIPWLKHCRKKLN